MSAGLVQLDPRVRSKKKMKPGRECLIQKCHRHFDIKKVGDSSHLSFFQMAGAFEVQKFNEIKTIEYLWNFLTKILEINRKKVWITAFKKDRIAGQEISLSSKLEDYLEELASGRLIYGQKETNLWSQGGGAKLVDNLRLCGPQVEFFYDLGRDKGCGRKNCGPFCDCGRFREISNTLFIKYAIDYSGENPRLVEIVNPSTESVIGIERVTQIAEQKDDLFKISHFWPLVETINRGLNEEVKIIVDHMKSLCLILGEKKIKPGKRDRRRIIRTLIRQMLTSFYVLKVDAQKLIPQLIDQVVDMYEEDYPAVRSCKKRTLEIISFGEEKYQKTLEKGRRIIRRFLEKKGRNKLLEKEKEFFWKQFGVPKKILESLLAVR